MRHPDRADDEHRARGIGARSVVAVAAMRARFVARFAEVRAQSKNAPGGWRGAAWLLGEGVRALFGVVFDALKWLLTRFGRGIAFIFSLLDRPLGGRMQRRLDRILRALGMRFSGYLGAQIPGYRPVCTYDMPALESCLRPGDILLVDGNTRISTAIKYLTRSTWSHCAFYAGAATRKFAADGEPCPLIEAEMLEGVIASPLSKYQGFNTRICRAVNLRDEDRDAVIGIMIDSLGLQYDMRHIYDLAWVFIRGHVPTPEQHRRSKLNIGSGDLSKVICSAMIAKAFQAIRYPILPLVNTKTVLSDYHYSVQEILHIRHHSLYAPRDFDVSPYFHAVKPTIEAGFDYRTCNFVESLDDLQAFERTHRAA
ncbi:MAG: hypothetical protein ACR2P7_05815 [bacterium]